MVFVWVSLPGGTTRKWCWRHHQPKVACTGCRSFREHEGSSVSAAQPPVLLQAEPHQLGYFHILSNMILLFCQYFLFYLFCVFFFYRGDGVIVGYIQHVSVIVLSVANSRYQLLIIGSCHRHRRNQKYIRTLA